MYGNQKMEMRKKALAGMLKKGPMGPGAVKHKSLEPISDEFDAMHESMESPEELAQEQKMGAEYVQFMVSPKEKEMIISMRKKMGGHKEPGFGEPGMEG